MDYTHSHQPKKSARKHKFLVCELFAIDIFQNSLEWAVQDGFQPFYLNFEKGLIFCSFLGIFLLNVRPKDDGDPDSLAELNFAVIFRRNAEVGRRRGGISCMRISGGLARGIILQCAKNTSLRPTMDAVREAVFSILGESVIDARFVDVFAGTGSYGLEAISRGASAGIFIESHGTHAAILGENLQRVAKSASVDASAFSILRHDAFRWQIPAADLFFFDPPYAFYRDRPDELRVLFAKCIRAGTLAVVEMPSRCAFELLPTAEPLKIIGANRQKDAPKVLILRGK